MNKYEILLQEIKEEFPDFSLVYKKDSKLMSYIGKFLYVISFGKNDRFMSEFTTTIKNTIYLSDKWDTYTENSKCTLLRHERVHMRQAKRLGFYWFTFLYLVVFFPVGLAYYRAKFEQEAYEESLRAIYEYYGAKVLQSKGNKNYITRFFTGPDYGWMFPFQNKIDAWYDNAVSKILAENKSSNQIDQS